MGSKMLTRVPPDEIASAISSEKLFSHYNIIMIIRGEIKYYCVFHSLFGSKSFLGVMSHYFWKCPHFFKGGGTLSPILKFLGRTLPATFPVLI